MLNRARARVLVVVLSACGGGAASVPPPEAAPAAATTSDAPSRASIDAFHEVIAPLWHAPESSERTEQTCAAVPTLEQRAQEIGDAKLVESIHALAAECAGDRGAVQGKFSSVHDAFHAAMEKGGVAHEHH